MEHTFWQTVWKGVVADIVMSAIAFMIVGPAAILLLAGKEVTTAHAGFVGLILAYYFTRNHITEANRIDRELTVSTVAKEVTAALANGNGNVKHAEE